MHIFVMTPVIVYPIKGEIMAIEIAAKIEASETYLEIFSVIIKTINATAKA